MTTEKKTPAEIGRLRQGWMADPCWDIEATEGFEAHRDELLAFRLATEAMWEREARARLEALAEKLGCPGNLPLAKYVVRLEGRIEALERRLDNP